MIIADTGFWVAIFDRRDNLHQKVRACAAQIQEPLITTLPTTRIQTSQNMLNKIRTVLMRERGCPLTTQENK